MPDIVLGSKDTAVKASLCMHGTYVVREGSKITQKQVNNMLGGKC